MKKQMKSLILGIVVVVVLAVVLLVVTLLPESEPASSSSLASTTKPSTISLLELTTDDIESIEVKNAEEYTLVRNAEDAWVIEELEDLPGIKSSYTLLASSISTVVGRQTVDENPSDLSQFGLDNPASVVTAVMKDGSRHTVEVGNEAPGGGGYTYLKLAGEPAVYTVNTSDVARMLQVRTDYISTDIFDLTDTSTTPTVLGCIFGGTSRAEEMVLEPLDVSSGSYSRVDSRTGYSSHQITSPRNRDTNTTVFTSVSESVFSTVVNEIVAYHVTDEQIAEYGLDDPYTTLKMSYTEDSESTERINYRASEMDENGNFYLMAGDVPVIYRASIVAGEYPYNWHNIQYEQLASRLFILPNINDVAAITVKTTDGSYRFELNKLDEKKQSYHYGDTEISESVFKKFYQVLIGATSEKLITSDEGLNLTSPLLTCTFEYVDADHQKDVISYYKGPTRYAYVSVNGEVEFTTRDVYIDKVYGDIPKVINNEEVTIEW